MVSKLSCSSSSSSAFLPVVSGSSQHGDFTIKSLPPELLTHIFMFAADALARNGECLLSLRTVSSCWKDVIDNHVLSAIWSRFRSQAEKGLLPSMTGLFVLSIDKVYSLPKKCLIELLGRSDHVKRMLCPGRVRIRPSCPVNLSLSKLGVLEGVVEDRSLALFWDVVKRDLFFSDESPGPFSSKQAVQWLTNPKNEQSVSEIKSLWMRLSYDLFSLPSEIGRLKGLRSIVISSTSLVMMPRSMGQLEGLQSCCLSKNSLYSIPETIGNLRNLRSLDLSENKLVEIPRSIGDLTNLTDLDLSSNSLRKVPRSLANLSKLHGLNVSQNQLRTLPRGLSKWLTDGVLSFHTNWFSSIPEAVLDTISSCALDGNIDWWLCVDAELKGSVFGQYLTKHADFLVSEPAVAALMPLRSRLAQLCRNLLLLRSFQKDRLDIEARVQKHFAELPADLRESIRKKLSEMTHSSSFKDSRTVFANYTRLAMVVHFAVIGRFKRLEEPDKREVLKQQDLLLMRSEKGGKLVLAKNVIVLAELIDGQEKKIKQSAAKGASSNELQVNRVFVQRRDF